MATANLPTSPQFKNLTNQIFGKLTVLAYAGSLSSISPRRTGARWLCKCFCGAEVTIDSCRLLNGDTKSCGCARRDRDTNGMPLSASFKNLLGMTFGKLTVFEYVPTTRKKTYWKCVCECGNFRVVDSPRLTSGICLSCGCTRRKSLLGRVFGKLEVIAPAQSNSRDPRWQCRCVCGRVKDMYSKHLTKGWFSGCDCEWSNPNFIDRTGERFGKLVLVRRVGSKNGSVTWMCDCDCGGKKVCSAKSLVGGNAKSCGCSPGGKGAKKVRKVFSLPPGESAKRSIAQMYRAGAKKRNLAWSITDAEFFELTQGNCYYCDSPPSRQKVISENGCFIWNGIDRRDNQVGYVSGNVVTCCSVCNRAKNTLSEADFIAWLARAYQFVATRHM